MEDAYVLSTACLGYLARSPVSHYDMQGLLGHEFLGMAFSVEFPLRLANLNNHDPRSRSYLAGVEAATIHLGTSSGLPH